MSGNKGQSIGDLASQVVQADVSSQKAIEEQEKGTWTPIATGVPFVPDWSQKGPVVKTGWTMWQKAAAVIAAIAVLGVGVFAGYSFLNSQPAGTPVPTSIAQVPTQAPATFQPTSAPTQAPATAAPTAELTPVPGTPAPTAAPTGTPVATAPPITIADGLDEIMTGDPEFYDDDGEDQDREREDDPEVDRQAGLDMNGGFVGPAQVANGEGQALAMVDSQLLGSVRSAQVEEFWPCTDAAVICGPGTLDPGDYFVIGFSTSAPPPTDSPAGIYQVFYVMTDLDGDWTNNAFVTPPNTNYIYLSSQYVIEGGFFGETKGLGETDYRGAVGPDGQTPRYNQTPASRLVLSQDPPGGFFLIPEDRIGSWYRVATMWQDFNAEERHILVDALGAQGGLEMIPVPGRTEPLTMSCARVDVSAEPLGDMPMQLVVTFTMAGGAAPNPGSTANLTLVTTTQEGANDVPNPELPIQDLGNGSYSFAVGVPGQSQNGFKELVLGGGPDVAEDLIVLAGAGVNVPDGYSGPALGNPDCGS